MSHDIEKVESAPESRNKPRWHFKVSFLYQYKNAEYNSGITQQNYNKSELKCRNIMLFLTQTTNQTGKLSDCSKTLCDQLKKDEKHKSFS